MILVWLRSKLTSDQDAGGERVKRTLFRNELEATDNDDDGGNTNEDVEVTQSTSPTQNFLAASVLKLSPFPELPSHSFRAGRARRREAC